MKTEVFSNLLKLETLFPLEDKTIPGSLVYESLNPFPGYYSETPDSSPPVYLYLALDRPYRLEEILRATQAIEPLLEEHFDAGKGILTVVNEEIPVIRLRHFGNYDLVARLQEAYRDQGILPLMRVKKREKYTSLARIVKFLYLKQIGHGVFMDVKEDFHWYVEIPFFLDWEKFKEATRQVKYNWFGSKFDAASGSFYADGRLHEFVRIYSNKLDVGDLVEIQKLYVEKMSHPL